METTKLKNFAQKSRVSLIEQITTQLKFVRAEESLARREHPIAVKKLESLINQQSEQEVVERIAYIWFNRFCALRFMDMNRYNRINVVSAANGETQPQILATAKMGDIDDRVVSIEIREQIFNLLNGKAPSRNPEAEVYRLLLVAYCNQWHESMPFLFQRIDDYTELLMPDDLLSSSSVLADMREAIPAEACEDVEVIGWLYQFYISDKKDNVLAGLKKQKITAQNIPAATQLFTPHWIVRYLVENSLGRLWLLNYPESKLADSMEYYIKPAKDDNDTDYLKVARPQDLKICDPACGSGHMLTYAFDLLYAIYEEQGYDAVEIPSLILTHNLYGIEIDERAGELAAFALTMKARARHSRFFNTGIRPNICVLEPISFDDDELDEYMNFIGQNLLATTLKKTLHQFKDINSFGSLVRPALTDAKDLIQKLDKVDVSNNLFLNSTHQKVIKVLNQVKYLSPKYNIVVANPPYLSDKYFSTSYKSFSRKNYKKSCFNLYSMFIDRSSDLVVTHGFVAMITLHSWMFGSKYKALRKDIIEKSPIETMVHLGSGGFDSIGGQVVSTTAFILEKNSTNAFEKIYIDLTGLNGEFEMSLKVRNISNNNEMSLVHKTSENVLKKLPTNPIVYWISKNELMAFEELDPLHKYANFRQGMATTDNDTFLRRWTELSLDEFVIGASSADSAISEGKKWFPYNKGGGDRRWYGHNDFLVCYENNGEDLIELVRAKYPNISDPEFVIKNRSYYFLPSVTYSALSGGDFAARLSDEGFIFDTKGSCAFPKNGISRKGLSSLLNSRVASNFLKLLAPTLDFNLSALSNIPFPSYVPKEASEVALKCYKLSKSDWDSYENSWDFTTLPLLEDQYRKLILADTYQNLHTHWQKMTDDMQRLEEENNRIFIDAYGLQGELTPEVPLKEITLTCNPYYRYGGDKTTDELEVLLLADTMRELISYAVGCMFGRYSLDKPGLILANQGDKIEQYLEQIPNPSFMPDKNNVIPILDDGWFSDDIVERFRKFIKVAFGEAQYESNMQFIEQALGKNDKSRDIRDYFLKDFYNDHVKRYKKRPIYWLFSSGNFNALIYMHRYQPDTVSIVLNDYLREFRIKLDAYRDQLNTLSISSGKSQGEKTKALKQIENISKTIIEIEEYERDVLYPLAAKQIEIDLDDGVKVNYPKFGNALKQITGLS